MLHRTHPFRLRPPRRAALRDSPSCCRGAPYQHVCPQTANTPPEKSRNIELSAKLDWLDDQLSTRIALFRTGKYNERTTDADLAGSTFLLSGKRHSQGIDVGVVGRISKALEVYVSTAYIPQATIDAAGNAQANVVGSRVGLTPKASAWLSYQAMPRLRIAAVCMARRRTTRSMAPAMRRCRPCSGL